jgi:integrase
VETVKSAIELYVTSDEIARLAPKTIKRHKIILELLVELAGPSMPVARLSRAHVDQVLADRRQRGCTASTLNSYRSVLRMMGAWLLAMTYVKHNIAAHLKNTKTTTARSKRKGITADQARDMIKRAFEQHPRDGMSIMLLIFTGCRSSEICGLRWRDVDQAAGTLSVFRSKVTDWLTIVMPAELAEALAAWRAHPMCANAKSTDFVVPSLVRRGFQEGKIPYRMDPTWPLALGKPQSSGLLPRVKQLLRDVGETDLVGRGCHTLRRTAAQLVHDQYGIGAARFLLGHASDQQTIQYLDLSAQQAKYGAMIKSWSL